MDLKQHREAEDASAKPLAIPIGGDVLNIRYRPSSATAGEIRKLADLQKVASTLKDGDASPEVMEASASIAEANVTLFLQRVASWDLTDDSVPVPLTAEGLEKHRIGSAMLNIIQQAIQADESPKPTTAPTSVNT